MVKALHANLVFIERCGIDPKKHNESSRKGNDTDVDDADIRPVYDKEPMATIQLTTECNLFAKEQHHVEQLELINEGRIDKDVVQ
nr:hypothetical protein [Tanacetum cinerariifolium]